MTHARPTMSSAPGWIDQQRMKAIVRDTYGSADGLQLRDIDTPGIADDEVFIRVHAAGVDRGVWHVMTGLPYPIRLAGYGLRAPKNPVLGADVAGVVEAVGSDVTRFQSGDEVFGIGKGTFAEYARAPENKLASKPATLSFEQAAVVAISGLTALQGLRDRGKVERRPEGVDHRCVWRRGDLRRADRQGVRGKRDRRVQHAEGRHGPLPGCRPRHRLHA